MWQLRSGIETRWCWLQFSALLDVVTALVSRTNAGASRGDSCQGIGAGPLEEVGGPWSVCVLSFPSFFTQRRPPAPSCRVPLVLLGAAKR